MGFKKDDSRTIQESSFRCRIVFFKMSLTKGTIQGDRVVFIEDNGRLMITKASILAFRELQKEISQEAEK